jgi:type I restriction enzyme M protein
MANISGIVKSIQRTMWNDTGLNGDAQRIEQLGWMLFFKIFSDKDKELEIIQDDYTSPIPDELHWDEWAGDDEGITGDELLEFVDQKLFPTLKNIDISSGNKRAYIVHEVFNGNHNYMKSGTILRQVINKLNEINFNNSKDKHMFGDVYESFLKELQSAGKSGEFYTPRAIVQFLTDIVDPQLGEKILDTSCGTGGFLTATVEHLKEQSSTVEDMKNLQENVIGWEYKPLPYLLATTNLILHDVGVPNIRFDDSLSRSLNEYSKKDKVDVILANPPFGGIVSNNNEENFPQTYRTKESADLFLILMIHLLKEGGRAAIVLPDGSLTGGGVKERVRKKLLEDCNLHTIVRLPNSVFKPYADVATNLLFFTKGEKTKKVWYYEHKLPNDYKSYTKNKPIRLSEFDTLKDWWNNRQVNDQAWQVDVESIKVNGYNLDIKNPHQVEEEIQHTSAELLELLHQSFVKSDDFLTKIKSELL